MDPLAKGKTPTNRKVYHMFHHENREPFDQLLYSTSKGLTPPDIERFRILPLSLASKRAPGSNFENCYYRYYIWNPPRRDTVAPQLRAASGSTIPGIDPSCTVNYQPATKREGGIPSKIW